MTPKSDSDPAVPGPPPTLSRRTLATARVAPSTQDAHNGYRRRATTSQSNPHLPTLSRSTLARARVSPSHSDAHNGYRRRATQFSPSM